MEVLFIIVTTPYTYDPDTLRENSIIESRTSTCSIRSSYYINPSSLNKKSIKY